MIKIYLLFLAAMLDDTNLSSKMAAENQIHLGPVYMIPLYRDLGLLIIYCYFCSWVYMETGTSRLTGIPFEATETPVKWDKLCSYKRSEMKFKTTTSDKGKPPKKKTKKQTFVGMLFMRTQLIFVLLTNYYQLFHAVLNEIDTSRSPGTSWCTKIDII